MIPLNNVSSRTKYEKNDFLNLTSPLKAALNGGRSKFDLGGIRAGVKWGQQGIPKEGRYRDVNTVVANNNNIIIIHFYSG